MPEIKDILNQVSYKLIQGDDSLNTGAPEFDSRQVRSTSLFFAIKGTQTDGHKYIGKAIESGATAIVLEERPEMLQPGITYLQVKDTARALALAASAWYEHPSEKLTLIGITGTNGKTSIASLLYHFTRDQGFKSGLLSTIKILINDREVKASHTTPDPLQINKMLSEMVDSGCEYCFMEVSSHALVQQRVQGLRFAGAIFTNLTHDHLDYHKSFKEYLNAKKILFDNLPKTAFAISNADDKNGMVILQNTQAEKYIYGLKNTADYKGKVMQIDFNGMQLQFDNTEFFTDKTGIFNAYNLLAVYACARALGFSGEDTLTTLSKSHPVSGRFEILRNSEGIYAIVDYAHTPDALENVLRTITEINTSNNKVITVFGCGGNRDKTKRPEMGKIAVDYSQQVIITSDNPRFEDPEDIIRDIETGIPEKNYDKVLVIENRGQAIKTACRLARPGDIILVAGKGHEDYQDIKGIKSHFDDKEQLQKYLMK